MQKYLPWSLRFLTTTYISAWTDDLAPSSQAWLFLWHCLDQVFSPQIWHQTLYRRGPEWLTPVPITGPFSLKYIMKIFYTGCSLSYKEKKPTVCLCTVWQTPAENISVESCTGLCLGWAWSKCLGGSGYGAGKRSANTTWSSLIFHSILDFLCHSDWNSRYLWPPPFFRLSLISIYQWSSSIFS